MFGKQFIENNSIQFSCHSLKSDIIITFIYQVRNLRLRDIFHYFHNKKRGIWYPNLGLSLCHPACDQQLQWPLDNFVSWQIWKLESICCLLWFFSWQFWWHKEPEQDQRHCGLKWLHFRALNGPLNILLVYIPFQKWSTATNMEVFEESPLHSCE